MYDPSKEPTVWDWAKLIALGIVVIPLALVFNAVAWGLRRLGLYE